MRHIGHLWDICESHIFHFNISSGVFEVFLYVSWDFAHFFSTDTLNKGSWLNLSPGCHGKLQKQYVGPGITSVLTHSYWKPHNHMVVFSFRFVLCTRIWNQFNSKTFHQKSWTLLATACLSFFQCALQSHRRSKRTTGGACPDPVMRSGASCSSLCADKGDSGRWEEEWAEGVMEHWQAKLGGRWWKSGNWGGVERW